MIDAESTIERLIRSREQTQANVIENEEQYKLALNSIAQTPNGEHVLRVLIKACGVFAVKPSRDGASLVADKALRDLYLSVIRPYLEPDIRQHMER